MLRSSLLFVGALLVGCGGRVADSAEISDAAVDAPAPDARTDTRVDPAPDVSVPTDCALRDNPCFRQLFAAYERARTCFPPIGGACGKLQPDSSCAWPDGARSQEVTSPDGLVGMILVSASGVSCARMTFVGGSTGSLEFADGTRFGVEDRGRSATIQCADGTSFVTSSDDDACMRGFEICCE